MVVKRGNHILDMHNICSVKAEGITVNRKCEQYLVKAMPIIIEIAQ